MDINRKKQIENAIAVGTLITGATYGLYYFFKTLNSAHSYHCQDQDNKVHLNKGDICVICHESKRIHCRSLDCQHSFHRRCIREWEKISNTCPICRSPIDERCIVFNIVLYMSK
ncbi:E3 ubiquitin-protein ligase RNF181-like [Asbolus verrucosus]|uniref:E3 ubiquitin-protein ligase RNF181-like n=1 Tax=Asbolus verrucosus TaxID=1661398 RepID=A0A482W7U6_ASBVE|nr:E3 ubiquitin-protein ligase RNF181-like [Asbolus verrucosus]